MADRWYQAELDGTICTIWQSENDFTFDRNITATGLHLSAYPTTSSANFNVIEAL